MELKPIFEQVQEASRELVMLENDRINEILFAVADEAVAQTDYILAENAKDLARMDEADPKYDRLKLTAARLQDIAADMRKVAQLPSPLGRVLKHHVLQGVSQINR